MHYAKPTYQFRKDFIDLKQYIKARKREADQLTRDADDLRLRAEQIRKEIDNLDSVLEVAVDVPNDDNIETTYNSKGQRQ